MKEDAGEIQSLGGIQPAIAGFADGGRKLQEKKWVWPLEIGNNP